ncbi:YciI family protein [Anaerocolumna sp. AGMB13020]|uniref:YciI family protein n=1 Tax=Anaerocolumna sp. AGMB13020 TaxID=3081750 RepID=UPI002953A3CB|nr:YciI family protein [Anaerocolumna sp. AGMB13020]WOO34874.1 YciI family protein [Anaerocolumna sp. AGMB13020]
MTFVYLMKNQNQLKKELVEQHVEHLKQLKKEGRLILCGPFGDYPGGMVVFSAQDKEEADRIAQSDPFVSSGCKTYELRTMEIADEANNYLL